MKFQQKGKATFVIAETDFDVLILKATSNKDIRKTAKGKQFVVAGKHDNYEQYSKVVSLTRENVMETDLPRGLKNAFVSLSTNAHPDVLEIFANGLPIWIAQRWIEYSKMENELANLDEVMKYAFDKYPVWKQ